MKKAFAMMLSLIIALSLAVPSLAIDASFSDNRFSQIENTAESFLDNININQNISTYKPLYNLGDKLEAYLFILDGGGYLVVSYKDGHVIEFSPESLPISLGLSSSDNIYYAGPLSFCVKEGTSFTNIVTNEQFTASSDYYSIDYSPTLTTSSNYGYAVQSTSSSDPLLPNPETYISATSWYCTPTGITNLLQYYHDIYGADVYSGSVSSVTSLANTLVDDYIYNGPLHLSDAVSSHLKNWKLYSGLQSYLNRSDVDNYTAVVTYLTANNVKAQLGTYSRPVLLQIYTASIDDGYKGTDSTHIVLCYGYWETSMTTYYIVNNGWGSNGVYVCADDVPSDFEMMYLV